MGISRRQAILAAMAAIASPNLAVSQMAAEPECVTSGVIFRIPISRHDEVEILGYCWNWGDGTKARLMTADELSRWQRHREATGRGLLVH